MSVITWRRLKRYLALALCFILVTAYLSQAERPQQRTTPDPPQGLDDVCAQFRYPSHFRDVADHIVEGQIEQALLNVEKGALRERINQSTVKKIWQVWKSEEVPEYLFQPRDWKAMHPGWEHTVVTDVMAANFVSNELASIPYLESVWSSYPRPVLRSDLLRYLLLWYWGGFYADIDVIPTLPVSDCAPLESIFDARTTPKASLVVGVEIDEPYASAKKRKAWHWSRTHGFIQYSAYAPQRFSPILRKVITRAIAHSQQHLKETATWYRPSGHFDDEAVLETTGPGMFTDAILDMLTESLPSDHALKDTRWNEHACIENNDRRKLYNINGGAVTWSPFHHLNSSLSIESNFTTNNNQISENNGLLVLPIDVWGNGQRHSGAGNFTNSQACINHIFVRAWKPRGFWSRLLALGT